MTSEVVVMNRLGIALASDSAATVYSGGRAKVFHADKLFMLSQRHPVGVMIYNNSSLLGVPWETILKMFRRELGTRELDTLEEYAARLIKYLENNKDFFPEEVQKRYYLELVAAFFDSLRQNIERAVIETVTDNEDDGPDVAKLVAKRIISETRDEWQKKRDIACFLPEVGVAQSGQFSGEIHKLIEKYFVVWQIDGDSQKALWDLTAFLVSKDEILAESQSGVVIAGYGAKEHFPVMQAFELGEIVQGKLKYREFDPKRIDSEHESIVQPFAESEMVDAFLNGISPAFEIKLVDEIATVLLQLPDVVIDGLPGIGRKRKEAFKQKVRPISADLVRQLADRLNEHVTMQRTPVHQAIAFLPKNELAHFAASLVNLNSFRKRMSIDEDETVAGPIDVAVISKGDGFVWIARKHYFPKELNYHFFKNYGAPADEKGEGNAGKTFEVAE